LRGQFGWLPRQGSAAKVLLVDFDPQTNASLSLMTEARWGEWQREHGRWPTSRDRDQTKHAADSNSPIASSKMSFPTFPVST
jgi:cellulose biosynthesis protein BcsQ